MIDPVELGRRMMHYAPKLENDAEFNQWCRLAPKLIAEGNNELTKFDLVEKILIKQVLIRLIKQGELII